MVSNLQYPGEERTAQDIRARQPRPVDVTNRSRAGQTAETADKDDNQLVNSRSFHQSPISNLLLPLTSRTSRLLSTAAAIKFPRFRNCVMNGQRDLPRPISPAHKLVAAIKKS